MAPRFLAVLSGGAEPHAGAGIPGERLKSQNRQHNQGGVRERAAAAKSWTRFGDPRGDRVSFTLDGRKKHCGPPECADSLFFYFLECFFGFCLLLGPSAGEHGLHGVIALMASIFV